MKEVNAVPWLTDPERWINPQTALYCWWSHHVLTMRESATRFTIIQVTRTQRKAHLCSAALCSGTGVLLTHGDSFHWTSSRGQHGIFHFFQLCPERTREMCEDCRGLKRTHFSASASNLIILPIQQQQFHALKVQPPQLFSNLQLFLCNEAKCFFFLHCNFQAALLHDWYEKAVPVRPSVKLS